MVFCSLMVTGYWLHFAYGCGFLSSISCLFGVTSSISASQMLSGICPEACDMSVTLFEVLWSPNPFGLWLDAFSCASLDAQL
jgi:hypothetical protein